MSVGRASSIAKNSSQQSKSRTAVGSATNDTLEGRTAYSAKLGALRSTSSHALVHTPDRFKLNWETERDTAQGDIKLITAADSTANLIAPMSAPPVSVSQNGLQPKADSIATSRQAVPE